MQLLKGCDLWLQLTRKKPKVFTLNIYRSRSSADITNNFIIYFNTGICPRLNIVLNETILF